MARFAWPIRGFDSAGLTARWRGSLVRSAAAALDLVFPPDCAFCRTAIDSSAQGLLCPACRRDLLSGPPACARCGRSTNGPAHDAPCAQCAGLRYPFERTVRMGVYEGPLRMAVLRAKRSGERELTMALAALLAEQTAAAIAAWRPHAVLAVPMHWTRRVRRGVNSPQVLARALAAQLDVPVADHLLVRGRRTAPQASLSPRERTANVRGAFFVRRHRDLQGARLVLVDDVMTTGATVKEGAKSLRRAGAKAIHVAVLARAEGLD